MSKKMGLACMALSAGLCGCDVRITDETPAEYPANHDIGMYEIRVRADRETMVSPSTVHVLARVGDKEVELSKDRDGNEWSAMYPVRCVDSFPLQYIVRWSIQGLTTRGKLEPQPPRTIRLIEPEPTREVVINTSEKSKKGWQGTVPFRFVTVDRAQITSARIEPLSDAPADVAAAKAITVTSELPLDAPCGTPVELQLQSQEQRAQGVLIVETSHPKYSRWETKVVFAPAT